MGLARLGIFARLEQGGIFLNELSYNWTLKGANFAKIKAWYLVALLAAVVAQWVIN